MRVLKYLNGTKSIGLTLGGDGPIEVMSYIDASYGLHENGKSHSGMSMSITGLGSVLAKSQKQKLTAKSSTEGEIIALSDMSSDALGMRQFLIHQGYSEMGAVTIGQDNQSAMLMMNRGRTDLSRTKHIDIRYFYLKDRIDDNQVKLAYVPTEDMVADILTKPLQGSLFMKLRNRLLGKIV